ncbi:MAG: alpha-mannosidase [Candidatus Lokiarchaeota archaeon]|nr:alpha-mannosidase [Candidatus Lokiarchaeota archaeon]
MIPQSHVDLAWLWRWDPETVQVCCKLTHGQAISNMNAFLDYTFSQSQVPLYRATEQQHPDIFKQMEARIKEGRWEVAGGLFVEFEGAEPCGESIVRQCVLGKRYFKQRFGIDVTTCWQEDAWTHPWQLPQVLVKCGMDAFFFNRGWQRPALFWWQGPDGSRVLAVKPVHALKGRSPFLDWMAIKKWIARNVRRHGLQDVMVRIGKGDHGGGPSRGDIEHVHAWARRHGTRCTIAFSRFDTYKNAVIASPAARRLPVHASELGFELQGDLTNCGEIKTRNRHCEALLLAAEKFSTIAARLHGMAYPRVELERAWEKLLFNQFHDIIGGSSIPDACKDAHHDYDQVEQFGRACLDQAIECISTRVTTRGVSESARPFLLFNPLAWDRVEVVDLPPGLITPGEHVSISTPDGRVLPSQKVTVASRDGRVVESTMFEASIPATGYATIHAIPCSRDAGDPGLPVLPVPSLRITEGQDSIMLENEAIEVEIDTRTGNVGRIKDKLHDRELLDASRRGNCLVAIVDEGDSEGRFVKHHDIAPRPYGAQSDISRVVSIKITERGPIRAAIDVIKRYQASTFTQRIMVHVRGARVDFCTTIDWHDVHRMIKVAFPLNMSTPAVTYHTQFGTIVRLADGCEYPAQYWIDLSCEDSGVTLLNDARHAHDVEGGQVRMSLLRSPTEPARNADEGLHVIRYALLPHVAPLVPGEAMRAGYAFNNPVVVATTTPHAGELPVRASYLRATPSDVVVEAIKLGFDSDAVVVRCFNASNAPVEAHLEGILVAGKRLAEITMLEDHPRELPPATAGIARFKCTPAEIKTIAIR